MENTVCKIECKENLCVFNGSGTCIRDKIIIKSNNNAYCDCRCLATDSELERLKKYYYGSIYYDIKDALEQERFKTKNLEKQIENNDKIIEELKKEQNKGIQHKSIEEILDNARKLSHPIKDEKSRGMYSLSDLEDMYINQGLSLRAMSEITDIPRTTLHNRLRNAGITDKKKSIGYEVVKNDKSKI